MAGLVDAQEGEVAVLTHFAIFGAVDKEGRVAGRAELRGVGVVYGEGDGLAAEPLVGVVSCGAAIWNEGGERGLCYVADVIGIAVIEGDADVVIEEVLKVLDEIGGRQSRQLDEKSLTDIWRRFSLGRIVQIHADSLLNVRLG